MVGLNDVVCAVTHNISIDITYRLVISTKLDVKYCIYRDITPNLTRTALRSLSIFDSHVRYSTQVTQSLNNRPSQTNASNQSQTPTHG
jgi:hypothetical protein